MLGEFLSQWQQMMASLQRVEQETVSSQNMANAIENMNSANRCGRESASTEGRATPPEELVGQHTTRRVRA